MIRKAFVGILLGSFAFFCTASLVFAAADTDELEKAKASFKSGHHAESFTVLHGLAVRGHPAAQCLVGLMYQKGHGVQKNARQAAHWYKKSARNGFADAENRLGHMYLTGEAEIEKDLVQAEHWLGQAARHGIAEAQLHLGKMYIGSAPRQKKVQEKPLSKRMLEGRRLILLARDQGLNEAQILLDEIPGYEKASTAIGSNVKQAETDYAKGLGNIETSWEGYADLVKSMDSLVTEAGK